MIYLKIRDYLEKNGIKQTWLAKEINIPAKKLSLILTGKATLHADVLFSICEKLGVKCESFRSDANISKSA